MMHRRWAGIVLSAMLVGCSGQNSVSPTGTSETTADKKPRVALIMKSLANEFFSTMANGAQTP